MVVIKEHSANELKLKGGEDGGRIVDTDDDGTYPRREGKILHWENQTMNNTVNTEKHNCFL